MIAAGGEATSVAPRVITLAQHFVEATAALLAAKKATSDEALSGIDQLNKAKALAEELRSREEAILVNPRLSSVGRLEELTALYKEFEGRFRFVRDGAETRKRAATELRDRLLATPKSDGNETVDYIQGKEIRERLVKLPMSERTKILLNAMATGNVQVLRSIELDPLAFLETDPLIEPDFLHRIKTERAKQQDNGKAWLRYETLLFVSERLAQLAMAIDLQLTHNAIPVFAPKTTMRKSEMVFEDTQAPPDKAASVDVPPQQQPAFQ